MDSYLDLSGCNEEIREKHKSMLIIPVRLGQHYCEIDMVMEAIPREEEMRLRQYARDKSDRPEMLDESLPIGFYLENIPPGAILHLVITDDNEED